MKSIRARKLSRKFFARDAKTVARELVGKVLVRRFGKRTWVCRIVETEAYIGEHDLACHASKGRTPRTEVMFGPAGYAYVYLIYGIHSMMNVVTGAKGDAQAVLIRAAEPIEPPGLRLTGPGLFARSMKISRRMNGADLCGSKVYFLDAKSSKKVTNKIGVSKRIGIEYSKHWAHRLLRFFDKHSVFVSKRVI